MDGISLRRLVRALQEGETVRIRGDVGGRLGSSMGVDLVRFGGSGGPVEGTGRIIVDGDVGSRMGISMLRGSIYVSGRIEQPMGNVIEVETDQSGFRKFVSLTEALERSMTVLEPNCLEEGRLTISDGILRDTIGARTGSGGSILIEGDAGMSTGILMRSGAIDLSGDADRNTGVLMRGGRIVVRGNAGDFTGAEMRGGEIFVAGSAGSFACAMMKGGSIYARDGRPVPPAALHALSPSEISSVARVLEISPLHAMIYRRIGL